MLCVVCWWVFEMILPKQTKTMAPLTIHVYVTWKRYMNTLTLSQMQTFTAHAYCEQYSTFLHPHQIAVLAKGFDFISHSAIKPPHGRGSRGHADCSGAFWSQHVIAAAQTSSSNNMFQLDYIWSYFTSGNCKTLTDSGYKQCLVPSISQLLSCALHKSSQKTSSRVSSDTQNEILNCK